MSTTSPSAELCPIPSMREIRELDAESLLSRMLIGLERFDPRVVELEHEQVSQAWLEDASVGTWPIRILIGHLADSETVLAHRCRKIIAEDNPTLTIWDEHAFIDGGLYGCTEGSNLIPPMGGDLAMIHTTRSWLVATLMQLTKEQWNRQGIHPTNGPVTVREIANHNCWHLERHAHFLNLKVEKILGPIPESSGCCGGGGGGCGCQGKGKNAGQCQNDHDHDHNHDHGHDHSHGGCCKHDHSN